MPDLRPDRTHQHRCRLLREPSRRSPPGHKATCSTCSTTALALHSHSCWGFSTSPGRGSELSTHDLVKQGFPKLSFKCVIEVPLGKKNLILRGEGAWRTTLTQNKHKRKVDGSVSNGGVRSACLRSSLLRAHGRVLPRAGAVSPRMEDSRKRTVGPCGWSITQRKRSWALLVEYHTEEEKPSPRRQRKSEAWAPVRGQCLQETGGLGSW